MSQASTASEILLLEIDAWTGVSVQTLRFASHSLMTKPNEIPANVFYDGKVKDFGSITRLLFSEGGTSGAPTVNVGFVELSNTGSLDALLNYGFDGREVRIKSLSSRNAPVSTAQQLFLGTFAGIDTSDATRSLRLRLRDMLAEIDQPLLSLRYDGTTTTTGLGIEGDTTLKDQIKPYAWGSNFEVPGKLVNAPDLIYQFANNPQTSITVYDGGVGLTLLGDVPSAGSLGGTIAAGGYKTCLAQGLARLGAVPAGKVTADLLEGNTRTAADVVSRMLTQFGLTAGDIDQPSVVALAALAPATVGIYVADDENCLSAVSKVLDSVGAAIAPTMGGVFQLIAIREPVSTVDMTLTLRDLLTEGLDFSLFSGPTPDSQGIPAWSVVINYAKAWQTQSESESFASVSVAHKQFMANEFRQVTSQNAAIKTAHPFAVELTFDTLLVNDVDAQAEALRRLNLYSVRRDRLAFTTFHDRGDVELGRSVKVQMKRFGYDNGKNFLVVGRSDDFTKRRVRLTLWG